MGGLAVVSVRDALVEFANHLPTSYQHRVHGSMDQVERHGNMREPWTTPNEFCPFESPRLLFSYSFQKSNPQLQEASTLSWPGRSRSLTSVLLPESW